MTSSINKITRVQLRRDYESNWESQDELLKENGGLVLAQGEFGIAVDAGTNAGGKFKIGDGTTRWGNLNYYGQGEFDIDLENIDVDLQPKPGQEINIGTATNRFKEIFVSGMVHIGEDPDLIGNDPVTNEPLYGPHKDVFLTTDGKIVSVNYYDRENNQEAIYNIPIDTEALPIHNLDYETGFNYQPSPNDTRPFQLPPTNLIQNQSHVNDWLFQSVFHVDKVKAEAYDIRTRYETADFTLITGGGSKALRTPIENEMLIATHDGLINDDFCKGAPALPGGPGVQSTIDRGTPCNAGDMLVYDPGTGWRLIVSVGGGGGGGITGDYVIEVDEKPNMGILVDNTNPKKPLVALSGDWDAIQDLP